MENIRNEIKSYISKSGWTLSDIVKEYNKTLPEDKRTTVQNLSNKLTRGTIKYNEVKAIANIIGFDILWTPQK